MIKKYNKMKKSIKRTVFPDLAWHTTSPSLKTMIYYQKCHVLGVILEPLVVYWATQLENLVLLSTIMGLNQTDMYRWTTQQGKYREFCHFHFLIGHMNPNIPRQSCFRKLFFRDEELYLLNGIWKWHKSLYFAIW